ncbi:BglG family transcription antiterminator [Clostridium sp. DL1XJH146]
MSDIKISSRVKRIIEILCDADGSITVKSISNKLSVSSRTILREIEDVEKWILSNGLVLNKKPRVGLSIEGTIDEKAELKNLLNFESVEKVFLPKERQSLILNELLQQNEPVKLFYFTTMFKVSEGTISNDLDKVEKKLKSYDLQLIRKPGLGVFVKGSENAFRKAMIALLYEYLDKKQILEIINEKVTINNTKDNESYLNQTRNRLLKLIDKETILKLEQIVSEAENNIEYKLADSSYVGLLVHLALAIKRIKNNENITMQKEVLDELKLSEEYIISESITDRISKAFEIDIPESEIGYVTMHLKGSKIRDVAQRKDDLTIGNFQLIKMANKIIKIAEKETGYSLKNNKNLLLGLVTHLQPTITRLKMDMEIRNPLLHSIKEKYLEYFEISKKSVSFLEDYFKKEIPESEIGFITMHLGAAIEKAKTISKKKYNVLVSCTSGIGSSKMLATRLDQEFKNIKIVDVVSTIEIDELFIRQNDIDFIISTVDFSNCCIPVIVVTPLLVEKDIEKINDYIFSLGIILDDDKKDNVKVNTVSKNYEFGKVTLRDKAFSLMIYSKSIVEIIDNYFYAELKNIDNIEALISEISLLVCKNKDKAQSIEKDILKREKSGSTILRDKGLILIHCKTDGLENLKLGVVRLERPITRKNEEIKIALIMLAPNKADKEVLEVISEISKSLVVKEHFVDVIARSSKEEIIFAIEVILNKFLLDRTLEN